MSIAGLHDFDKVTASRESAPRRLARCHRGLPRRAQHQDVPGRGRLHPSAGGRSHNPATRSAAAPKSRDPGAAAPVEPLEAARHPHTAQRSENIAGTADERRTLDDDGDDDDDQRHHRDQSGADKTAGQKEAQEKAAREKGGPQGRENPVGHLGGLHHHLDPLQHTRAPQARDILSDLHTSRSLGLFLLSVLHQ